MLIEFPRIIDGISTRLKAARGRFGISQAEMAGVGQVSRSTQLSYESGLTAPSTDYLRTIQDAGVDVPFVLYGKDAEEKLSLATVDWASIQQAHEDVEFFCMKFAPECPSSYRWEMVAQIYKIHQEKTLCGEASARSARQDLLRELWEKP